MLADLVPQLLVLVVLVGASAFFSGTEVALFSLRRVDKQQLGQSKHVSDRLILRLLKRPRRLIATILIGNELVNVSVSVVVASMTPLLFPDYGEVELAFVATLFALPLLLFLGEITPKTIAIKTSLGWSRKAGRSLWIFFYLVAPLRLVVNFAADIVMFPFGGSTAKSGPKDLSEDEYRTLVDAGSAQGQVKASERRLIHRVFEFSDKTVGQVMIPRRRVFALAYDLPTARLIKEIAEGGYSRVPIYQKSLDRVMGIVYAKDLVVQGTGLSATRRLSDMLHEPLFVPRSIPIERLFRIFKQRKTHMAIVVSEYGKMAGLVTMEDLLEELFGEIYDEREQQKAKVVPRLGSAAESGARIPAERVVEQTGPIPSTAIAESESESGEAT